MKLPTVFKDLYLKSNTIKKRNALLNSLGYFISIIILKGNFYLTELEINNIIIGSVKSTYPIGGEPTASRPHAASARFLCGPLPPSTKW